MSVRARPLSSEDAKSSPWRVSGNVIYIPNQSTKFEFDKIFGEDCSTRGVYETRTRDIVSAAVAGFNGTVFAYGQTSSGKTHTMRGSNSELGVIPLAVHDLFHAIQQEMDREFLLRMSYMEIYNEEINDLLAPEHRKLQIHESVERGIFVAGLKEEIVVSAEQVLELMEFGESHRHIGETNMNLYSSRSHTIFRMIIESRDRTDDAGANMTCDAVRVSVLNLVDLAGSERAAKTGAEGVRLKEGSHINKSLMTLGTVIKKLSEGAESQGGHVPYRDSKLTRILQPALGGNANTAIICNITLAQIHADETKSSLQFASRALRVTNHAHVNEILTDAALLKRQKKEIEELRAKLQDSNSEHLEEQILNLRNTLLKSELERERIALELEEEKRAQAEREKRLQEQAKKIENLCSMVFSSNREEICNDYKKAKRRDTWCPGKLTEEKFMLPSVEEKCSEVKPIRADSKTRPLFAFQELIKESSTEEAAIQNENCQSSVSNTCPDPFSLANVTSRRKISTKKSSKDCFDVAELQGEFGNLCLEFETHKIASDVKIGYLMAKLAEANHYEGDKCKDCIARNGNEVPYADEIRGSGDNATITIKQLQEKIANLEMEKFTSQQNLDSIYDLATEQSISTQEKLEKLYQELLRAREEAVLAHDKLVSASAQFNTEESFFLAKLSTEAHEIELAVENSRHVTESIASIANELLHSLAVHSKLLLELRPCASQILIGVKSVIRNHEDIKSCLRNEIYKLEEEKLALYNQALELQSTIDELTTKIQDSFKMSEVLKVKHETEKSEFLFEINMLRKEVTSLSSGSLAREKESFRKDLEKTKSKLKDTDSKLKNVIQEKTKLGGEKSRVERELKRLQSQKAMLECDMNKRESVIGRSRDSIVDRSSNVVDQKRIKGSNAFAELVTPEDYKKLEVLAFEMEATIAGLEDQLAMANEEKDASSNRADSLASDLEALSIELQASILEENKFKEEILVLENKLEESILNFGKMDRSLKTLSDEKEELSMQLTDALLTMEEEKAVWSSKEKASLQLIAEKENFYKAEVALLSEELAEARVQLDIVKKSFQDNKEHDDFSSSENLGPSVHRASGGQRRSPEIVNLQLDSNCQKTWEEVEILQSELRVLKNERQHLLDKVQELEKCPRMMELKCEVEQQSNKVASLLSDQIINSKEKVKLRMRLRGAQAKLDTFRFRYQETVDEMKLMNGRFKEASSKLKEQLVINVTEVINLKKQLAELKRR